MQYVLRQTLNNNLGRLSLFITHISIILYICFNVYLFL